jgi:molybdopterin-guanine dinucleotide biosynthesis protein MobB
MTMIKSVTSSNSTTGSSKGVDHEIPALAFAGFSGSGKTTVVEQTILALTTAGYKVAAVKHHSHSDFDIDIPGKDSYRFTAAGAQLTIVASDIKMAAIRKLEADPGVKSIVSEIRRQAADHPDWGVPDIILVEGYKNSGLPTILIARAAAAGDRTIDLTDSSNPAGVITDIPASAAAATAACLPVFSPDDYQTLLDFIVDTYL